MDAEFLAVLYLKGLNRKERFDQLCQYHCCIYTFWWDPIESSRVYYGNRYVNPRDHTEHPAPTKKNVIIR